MAGKLHNDNWLVVWNINFIFPYIGNFIIPIDFHIFHLTSGLAKVVRHWCVLTRLTCKCASRLGRVHNLAQLLRHGLRTRRFSEPTVWSHRGTNVR